MIKAQSLVIGILIGLLIAAIVVAVSYTKSGVIKENLETPNDVAKYFTDQTQAEVRDKVGQPIEGYEPFMFLQAYPGLKDKDFDGVKTLLGIYEIKDGELVYRETTAQVHSAAKAITSEGMQTLLDNVATRLNLDIENKADVDQLLEKLANN